MAAPKPSLQECFGKDRHALVVAAESSCLPMVSVRRVLTALVQPFLARNAVAAGTVRWLPGQGNTSPACGRIGGTGRMERPAHRVSRGVQVMVMAFGIGAGLAFAAPPRPVAAQDNNAAITLTPYPVDPIFYDGGAARGVDEANVWISGTTDAPDGAFVEGRLLLASDGTTQVHGWKRLKAATKTTGVVLSGSEPDATVSSGAWEGRYPGAQRNGSNLVLEVRIAGSTTSAVTAEEIVIGNSVAFVEQSGINNLFGAVHVDVPNADVYYPTLQDENAVFVWMNSGALGGYSTPMTPINNTTTTVQQVIPPGMAHMANVLNRGAPGERFLIIDAAVSGTSMTDLANDDNAGGDNRSWGPSFAYALTGNDGQNGDPVVHGLRDWGSDLGLLKMDWIGSNAENGGGYRRKVYPFLTGTFAADDPHFASYVHTGTAPDGNPYDPGVYPIENGTGLEFKLDGTTGSGDRFDNILYDFSGLGRGLLDPNVTKMHAIGSSGAMTLPNLSGGDARLDSAFQLRQMTTEPGLSSIYQGFYGPDTQSSRSGYPATTESGNSFAGTPAEVIGYNDPTHVSEFHDDGVGNQGRMQAINLLFGWGLGDPLAQAQDVPRFNRAAWSPSKIEFWFEDENGNTPRISTRRLERAAAEPGNARWDPINTLPRTEYSEGPNANTFVIKTTNETAAFTVGNTVQGGTSGAEGVIRVVTGGGVIANVTMGAFQDGEAITETDGTGAATVDGDPDPTFINKYSNLTADDLAYRTEVNGFWIDNRPARRVEINETTGRVEVFPDGLMPEFTSYNQVEYHGGKGFVYLPSGGDSKNIDAFDEYLLNNPVVPVSDYQSANVEGIMLRSLDTPPNALPAAATYRVADSGNGTGSTRVVSPSGNGGNLTEFTMEFVVDSGNRDKPVYLGGIKDDFELAMGATGGTFLRPVKDAGGFIATGNVRYQDVTPAGKNRGTPVSILYSVTLGSVGASDGRVAIYHNDVLVYCEDLNANAATLTGSKWLAFSQGGIDNFTGEVEAWRVWDKSFLTAGATGNGAPDSPDRAALDGHLVKELSIADKLANGAADYDAALADLNADPWRLDASEPFVEP